MLAYSDSLLKNLGSILRLPYTLATQAHLVSILVTVEEAPRVHLWNSKVE